MTYEPDITGQTEGTAASAGAHDVGQDELLAPGERDQLARRLDQAVQNFVDSPQQALQMADSAFDEATARLTEAIAERRRALRARWQGEPTAAETEELRLLLRRYRETTERLLHV